MTEKCPDNKSREARSIMQSGTKRRRLSLSPQSAPGSASSAGADAAAGSSQQARGARTSFFLSDCSLLGLDSATSRIPTSSGALATDTSSLFYSQFDSSQPSPAPVHANQYLYRPQSAPSLTTRVDSEWCGLFSHHLRSHISGPVEDSAEGAELGGRGWDTTDFDQQYHSSTSFSGGGGDRRPNQQNYQNYHDHWYHAFGEQSTQPPYTRFFRGSSAPFIQSSDDGTCLLTQQPSENCPVANESTIDLTGEPDSGDDLEFVATHFMPQQRQHHHKWPSGLNIDFIMNEMHAFQKVSNRYSGSGSGRGSDCSGERDTLPVSPDSRPEGQDVESAAGVPDGDVKNGPSLWATELSENLDPNAFDIYGGGNRSADGSTSCGSGGPSGDTTSSLSCSKMEELFETLPCAASNDETLPCASNDRQSPKFRAADFPLTPCSMIEKATTAPDIPSSTTSFSAVTNPSSSPPLTPSPIFNLTRDSEIARLQSRIASLEAELQLSHNEIERLGLSLQVERRAKDEIMAKMAFPDVPGADFMGRVRNEAASICSVLAESTAEIRAGIEAGFKNFQSGLAKLTDIEIMLNGVGKTTHL